jgi:hypothetical protein
MGMLGCELPYQFLPSWAPSCSLSQQQQQLACPTSLVMSSSSCASIISHPSSPMMELGTSSICAKDGEPRIPYPMSFVPTIHHVICGRGKKSYGHIGNKNFLKVVAFHMDDYAQATNKQEKSNVVQAVVDDVDAKGGFIRLDTHSGCYFKAEEGAGREKTSQALRDCLNHKYKSSKDIKRKNRKQKRIAKQAVRKALQTDKRPSWAPSAVSMDSCEDSCSKSSDSSRCSKSSRTKDRNMTTAAYKSIGELIVSFPSPRISSAIPPRVVSSTSIKISAATVSPSPIGKNAWHMDDEGVVFLVSSEPSEEHVLEPLLFGPEEVEDLPDDDMIGPFDFSL